eukprot:310194-Chlamydomonas_euryale.AAC.3
MCEIGRTLGTPPPKLERGGRLGCGCEPRVVAVPGPFQTHWMTSVPGLVSHWVSVAHFAAYGVLGLL